MEKNVGRTADIDGGVGGERMMLVDIKIGKLGLEIGEKLVGVHKRIIAYLDLRSQFFRSQMSDIRSQFVRSQISDVRH